MIVSLLAVQAVAARHIEWPGPPLRRGFCGSAFVVVADVRRFDGPPPEEAESLDASLLQIHVEEVLAVGVGQAVPEDFLAVDGVQWGKPPMPEGRYLLMRTQYTFLEDVVPLYNMTGRGALTSIHEDAAYTYDVERGEKHWRVEVPFEELVEQFRRLSPRLSNARKRYRYCRRNAFAPAFEEKPPRSMILEPTTTPGAPGQYPARAEPDRR